jgi:Lrp/AsnC family leucine-responsive transcriptional regulator
MPETANLDDTDRRIIELLQEDARRTVRDIAAAVHLSAAPVKRRIDRLELLGVIVGYTVILDESRIEPGLEAFTELRVTGTTDVEDALRLIMANPEVREAYTTAGDPDFIVRIRARDVRELQSVVNRLRQSGRVTTTKTLMVLDHRSSARSRVVPRRPRSPA